MPNHIKISDIANAHGRHPDRKSGASTGLQCSGRHAANACAQFRYKSLVPLAGLEPARCFHHLILSQGEVQFLAFPRVAWKCRFISKTS